jgi:putative heme-binding domain-containing protein
VKPDVKGAIYRVKKIGSHKVDDPRGEKIEWKTLQPGELVKLLDDPRPVVWWRTIQELSTRSLGAFAALSNLSPSEGTTRSRIGAVWTLARMKEIRARRINRAFISDGIGEARQAAIHVASLLREEATAGFLSAILSDVPLAHASITDRRLAAEALGRLGDPMAVPLILESLGNLENDRTLDHALTYALIELGADTTLNSLANKSPRVRRAALDALDQMPDGKLESKQVFAELNAPDAALRETAWWIAGRHPEWGGELAGYFAEQLKAADKLTPADREALAERLAKFAKGDAVQKVLSTALPGASPAGSHVILLAMARSGLKSLPDVWEPGIKSALVSSDPNVQKDALAVLQRVQSTKDFSTLLKDMTWPPEKGKGGWTFGFHLQVQSTAPPGSYTLDAKRTREYATWLDRNEPPEIRSAAFEVLSRSKITADGLQAFAPVFKSASVLDLPKLVSVFSKSTDEKVGLALVAALMETPVRAEVVKPVLEKYPAAVQAAAEKLYAKLAEARKDDIAKLERLVKELPAGDVRRGQAVFNGPKAQCASCHKIGYVGGMVGPDLTRIGGIRTERDLLESIVFPSASFVRSYEPVRVLTKDDRVLSGVVKSETPDAVVLTIAADKEERLARADIESIVPGTVSVMPDGLEKQLTVQELADLVAFLKASK